MSSSSIVSLADVDISRIGVAGKDHVAGSVGDSTIGVCGDIIQELLYPFVGGFGGRGSFLSEFYWCG